MFPENRRIKVILAKLSKVEMFGRLLRNFEFREYVNSHFRFKPRYNSPHIYVYSRML
jgi:hypothetical protein